MPKTAPKNPLADVIYLVVFGAFVGMSLYQLATGTASRFTWFFLVIGGVLFAATAWRMYQAYLKRTGI
jgi:uncharacterized membrane protein YczE